MQELKIGQPVTVKAVTEVGYPNDLEREAIRDEVSLKAVVIGRRVKYLGTLRTFGRNSFMNLEYESEQSELHVTGSLELWEVRTGMLNKPLLVADGDLEPCEEFELPRMYRRE